MTASVVLDGSSAPPALGDILRIAGAVHVDRVALSFEGTDTTYGELLTASVRVANALRAEGLGRGDRVAILTKNNVEFFEILFGAAMLGVVVVPVNWRLTAPEIGFLIADSGARLLFAGLNHAGVANQVERDAKSAVRVIEFDSDNVQGYAHWRAAGDDKDHRDPITAHMVALQLYTSGTTGTPKGVLLTHHSLNCVRVSQQQARWSRWTPGDTCLVSMPLFHIGGIGTALLSLYNGSRAVIMGDFTPETVFDHIERDRVTRLFLAPAAIDILLSHPRALSADYDHLEYILYGSSAISAAKLREAMAVFRCAFVQFYGMSETSGAVVALSAEDHDPERGERMRSAGKPLRGVEIAILDAAGDKLAPNTAGEIAIRSEANMRGYWNMPEATTACMQSDGFLRSGDVGYLDEDGYVYLCDRLKNLIITGGENVSPAEIEAVLCEYPNVVEAAVIGVPHQRWGEAVIAVIVSAPTSSICEEDLRDWVRFRLASYKVPKTFHFAATLPKNSSGKVLHRELREAYSAREVDLLGSTPLS
jgi:long-chain acyl-CoA synthetase